MNLPRGFLLSLTFLVIGALTSIAQAPPLGYAWKTGYPKTIVVGNLMAIEAEGYFALPKDFTVEKIRLRTQACIPGAPGTRDPKALVVDYVGKLGGGQPPPGPMGYFIYCTPEKNNLTAIFDKNLGYVVEFVVNVKDAKGNVVVIDGVLAPNAVAQQ